MLPNEHNIHFPIHMDIAHTARSSSTNFSSLTKKEEMTGTYEYVNWPRNHTRSYAEVGGSSQTKAGCYDRLIHSHYWPCAVLHHALGGLYSIDFGKIYATSCSTSVGEVRNEASSPRSPTMSTLSSSSLCIDASRSTAWDPTRKPEVNIVHQKI